MLEKGSRGLFQHFITSSLLIFFIFFLKQPVDEIIKMAQKYYDDIALPKLVSRDVWFT